MEKLTKLVVNSCRFCGFKTIVMKRNICLAGRPILHKAMTRKPNSKQCLCDGRREYILYFVTDGATKVEFAVSFTTNTWNVHSCRTICIWYKPSKIHKQCTSLKCVYISIFFFYQKFVSIFQRKNLWTLESVIS